VTLRRYAKHRRAACLPGGTLSAVQRALAAGRITAEPDGSIDPVKADRQWQEQTEPRLFASTPEALIRRSAEWTPTAVQARHLRDARNELHRLHDVLGDELDELVPPGFRIGDGPACLDDLARAYNAVLDARDHLDDALRQPRAIVPSRASSIPTAQRGNAARRAAHNLNRGEQQ
jgi:hypothetical protein